MPLNITTIKTSSSGAWQGDNPLNYAFPLLIVQTTLVVLTSRFLAFLLKPLRQPKVIAEIIAGILLGPSAVGRNKHFLHLIFPSWSTPILESVASIGLLFFLFLVGLELDLSTIRHNGKKAFGIALAGISLPFFLGAAISLFLRKAIHGEDKVGYGQYLMFMGVAMSITAFPVLARILAELKLLTTKVGQTAMAAAAFNDVAAWILLALAVVLTKGSSGGQQYHKSPLITIWVLISGVAFVTFMLFFVRPAMSWVVKRKCSPEHELVDEALICLTLTGVILSGFMTDLIGIHAIFGAFVFGLTIPKDRDFASKLITRIEDFVSGLLLPLYFASSGLRTDVAKIRGVEAWGLLLLVISTACVGKILGTFVVAMLCMIPARESLVLGVLMNTKGLVELIVLNIGKEKNVLNDEMFAILVLMALSTTFVTTPIVIALHKPLRRAASQTRRRLEQQSPLAQNKLRILGCVHGTGNVPSLIKLLELIQAPEKSPIKLYTTHLVELTDRPSSIVMVQRTRKNGFPFVDRRRGGATHNQIAAAFQVYTRPRRVSVRHLTLVSGLSAMHEDICHVAEDKRVAMIILPFHKQWRGETEEEMENLGHGWKGANQNVLRSAPCSVAVLVDRGYCVGSEQVTELAESTANAPKKVGVLVFGGPDDREALAFGGRMAENPTVKVTLVRFKAGLKSNCIIDWASIDDQSEMEKDEIAVAEFRGRSSGGSSEYVEKVVNNIAEEVLAIGKSRDYELLVVGKGRFRSTTTAQQVEHEELGPIGDILASSDHCILSSVLVVKQHIDNADNARVRIPNKEAIVNGATITNNQSSA